MRFYQADPRLENYWRGVILFGKNVASYKFALAHALYDLKQPDNDLITLEVLAVPFVRHLCAHLRHAPKQITSKSSEFLEACRQFNAGEISEEQLIAITVKRGFANVIDAFHNVNHAEIDKRFFLDERRSHKGIRLTDNFYQLTENEQFASLKAETDARWRLVEEAWAMNVSRNLIAVDYDDNDKMLFSRQSGRRVTITSCRSSLNGYQKGRCFYCFRAIGVTGGEENLADVDHFLPLMLSEQIGNLNGVWNLVLACQTCNRGAQGKFARIPSIRLLQRLHDRNEYFINSHLPLRETLIRQTGATPMLRHSFLQNSWDTAKFSLLHEWQPAAQGDSLF
ncbi:HNH endonuclease domain-containing protein [Pantoea agglomerans]|uniref:HNH endonuclease domain-containing protein n=1 Tax=Enterobacter agglomerans TaxID=549 RepID=UPI002165CEC9|nr:HNH endonuclease domain-containing protein [Pantoea agglomerans]UVV72400.1 HNH endonuclease [Pantoea agglomerans]